MYVSTRALLCVRKHSVGARDVKININRYRTVQSYTINSTTAVRIRSILLFLKDIHVRRHTRNALFAAVNIIRRQIRRYESRKLSRPHPLLPRLVENPEFKINQHTIIIIPYNTRGWVHYNIE